MIINFEGIDAPGDNVGTPVPNSYYGMNWTNFYALDPNGSIFIPSGIVNGTVSGTSAAYNANQNSATFTTQGADFDLNKGWFTGAWNNGLTITIDAWDDGVQVAHRVFTVDYDGPTKIKFHQNFESIDTVTISSSGGTEDNLTDAGAGTHFVVDNLVVQFEDVFPTRVPAEANHHHRHDGGHDVSAHGHGAGFADWMFA